MKYRILFFSSLFCGSFLIKAQIGINTGSPTKTMDVNGEMRIRNLQTSSSTGSYNLITADENGNIGSLANVPKPHNGDIKKGLMKADHKKWYILDGRPLSSLPASAQAAANSLGITGNLPDARGAILKTISGTETPGSVTGSNTRVLTVANLPRITFAGTSSRLADHTHNVVDRYRVSGSDIALMSSTTCCAVYGDNNPIFKQETTGAPNHSHTYSVTAAGGSSTPISILPKTIPVNIFIYLE